MDKQNRLDQVPLADLSQDEISKLRELEHALGDRYYLIAFQNQQQE